MQNYRRMTVERLAAATPEEEASLKRGFLDRWSGNSPPPFTDDFYDHGREQATSDKTGEISREQRRLAWELLTLKRSATDREWAEECLRRGDVVGFMEANDAHTKAVMASLNSPSPA